ncbi:MAG: hypothetical protein K2Q18_03975 [Bdellovibrionales bacterium]|nr:hypothetical protein [Bdellovibrionales bacterium]
MIAPLDSRLPSSKNYMSEHRLGSGTTTASKTTIDQSAVGGTEDASVTLNLDAESGAEQEARKKKKKQEDEALEEEKNRNTIALSDSELKTRNMRLLFAL